MFQGSHLNSRLADLLPAPGPSHIPWWKGLVAGHWTSHTTSESTEGMGLLLICSWKHGWWTYHCCTNLPPQSSLPQSWILLVLKPLTWITRLPHRHFCPWVAVKNSFLGWGGIMATNAWPTIPCWHFCGSLSPPLLALMGYNWHATTVSFFPALFMVEGRDWSSFFSCIDIQLFLNHLLKIDSFLCLTASVYLWKIS